MINIFITGGTGSVGSYVIDQFKDNDNYHLFVLARNISKVKQANNMTVVEGHMMDIDAFKEYLINIDYLIHIATSWGDQPTEDVNIHKTMELFNYVNTKQLKNIIYFSTASILDKNGNLLPQAKEFGTIYIQTKYLCREYIDRLDFKEKIKIIYPTMIWGGDENHPYTHVASGLKSIKNYVKLFRFFDFPLKFHFIHAEDIAKIVHHLVIHKTDKQSFVLGNKVVSYKEFIMELCKVFKIKYYFSIPISMSFIKLVAKLLNKQMSAWDVFSLSNYEQEYEVVNAQSFGLKSNYDTVGKLLSSYR